MKITTTNIKNITSNIREQELIKMDLADIADINEKLSTVGKKLYIYWEDQHTEYSCERTDPCIDYYGWYSIRNVEDNELIGLECPTEDDLQNIICTIWDMCNLLID